MSQPRTETAKSNKTVTNRTADDKRFLAEHGDHLSDSTKRAKWIHSLEERADRPSQTLATRSREVIEQWAAERGGHPATVPGTEHEGRPGVLRIAFTDDGDSRLQEIPWDDWFRSFDDRLLVFLYQENKTDGSPSTFFRLDNPEREDG